MKKIISLILMVMIVCSAISGCFLDDIIKQTNSTSTTTKKPIDYSEIEWEEKIYWEGDINDDFYPGHVLVMMDKAISEPGKIFEKEFFVGVEIETIVDLTSSPSPNTVFRQCFLLILKEKTKEAVVDAIKKLEKIDGIRAVEADNYIIYETIPNDLYYSSTSNGYGQWGLDSIQVPMVWDFTMGSSSVRVGVIDSGIASHLDLNGNYLDNDAWDFYNINSNEPSFGKADLKSHGTHVAGIIGAVGDNEIGISGVNWDVSLVQLRTTHSIDTKSAITNAINHANELWNTEQRIHILNLSVGIGGDSPQVENAIRSFCNNGGLFICSTGNTPQDNDETNHYPSFYASALYDDPIPNMITVGRIDINEERPDGANWGLNTIMLYAPGEHILSTIPSHICTDNSFLVPTEHGDRYACECERRVDQWIQVSEHQDNGYHYTSGSSMSTPHVSGVAALLLSVNPNLTAAQIKSCIMNGADDITITIGDGTTQSVKSLNAWGAFKYLMENYPIYEQNIGYNNVTYSYNVDADASYMKDNTAMMKFNVKEAGEYAITITSDNPMDVKLYNNGLQELDIVQIQTNENREIDIVCTLTQGTYYLRVNYLNNSDEGNVSVYIDCPHVHSYNYWVYVNSTTHRSECGCGAMGTTTAPHGFVPLIGSTDRKVCAGCGYTKTFGSDGGLIIMSNTRVSLNGSYILPDGNIVLVDEDVEAYLNGTLVFYDKDELPEMQ